MRGGWEWADIEAEWPAEDPPWAWGPHRPRWNRDGVLLRSADLCTRYGFGDGDAPLPIEALVGCPYPVWFDWCPILRSLIEDYLLPAIPQAVTIWHAASAHNRYRAREVDGAEFEHAEVVLVKTVMVTVPWGEVLRRVAGQKREGQPDVGCCQEAIRVALALDDLRRQA